MIAVWLELDTSDAFALPPASESVNTFRPLDLANRTTDREGLDIAEATKNLEVTLGTYFVSRWRLSPV